MHTQNSLSPLLFVGGLAAVVYFLQTKKGTDQLMAMLATALVTTTAQAIFSGNQRCLC